jgi:radical SAM superfamily enzyme YgiQ (UPF0313 family)
MKILLICPPSEVPCPSEQEYPLGLLYLDTVLTKAGHECIVKTYYSDGWNEKTRSDIIDVIAKEKPNVVGINCMTMNRYSCFQITNIINELNEVLGTDIKVILGGVHATSMYEQILENYPVDAIVFGEGEETIVELVEVLNDKVMQGMKTFLRQIPGIAFKSPSGEIIKTNPREPIHDLDSIPFPRHELFAEKIKKTHCARMLTSRGCPNACTYCSVSAYWGHRWRARSAKNVVDEIEYITNRMPYVEEILFYDDTFTLDNQRVMDICNDIIKRGIKVRWQCSGRVDVISKEMLIKMKEAGCVLMMFGVESGSAQILKNINKRITKEQIKAAIDMANEVGLKNYIYLMVGNQGETWETIKETSEFLATLKKVNVDSIERLQIYPNTEVYRLAKEKGIINDDFWIKETTHSPLYTAENSEEELTRMVFYLLYKHKMQRGLFTFLAFALKFFFKRPKKAIQYAWRMIV